MLDRGQSETLGFIIIFALMLSMSGIVYLNGYAGLQDVRDAEQVKNARVAFEILEENTRDLVYHHVPSQSTEINLVQAQLSVGSASTVTVNIPTDGFEQTYSILPIVYEPETGTSTLSYTQGAVIRQDGTNGVVLEESILLMNSNQTIIPIVRTSRSNANSISGQTRVRITTDRSRASVVYSNISHQNQVWFNVSSSRADAWQSYLDGKTDVSCLPLTNGEASCRITTDRVHIVVVDVAVTFS